VGDGARSADRPEFALPSGYESGDPTGKSGSAGLFWSGGAFLTNYLLNKSEFSNYLIQNLNSAPQ